MSNWAENPLHQKQSLMSYALPHILFQECHKYCVNNSELRVAETDGERTCISNCQSKTYAAFDLYMQVQVRVQANKTARSFVDLSRYTDMEIEHQHDTASEFRREVGNHVHPSASQPFIKTVESQLADIKQQALQ